MLSLVEQEILVDLLEEAEELLFNLSEQLGFEGDLDKAWRIVYKRLEKEKEKEAKMKGENL